MEGTDAAEPSSLSGEVALRSTGGEVFPSQSQICPFRACFNFEACVMFSSLTLGGEPSHHDGFH